jgi:hypothetical protein
MKLRVFLATFQRQIRLGAALLATVGLIAQISDSASAYTATNGGWSWTVQGTSMSIDGVQ